MEAEIAMVSDELRALAETVARWVDDVPGISKVYLFGSHVRGDYRPDSDVDLRLFVEDMGTDNETIIWWVRQNESEFAELKAKLPGPLGLHRDDPDTLTMRSGKATRCWWFARCGA
jgi:predicted nucleotidyltransferase